LINFFINNKEKGEKMTKNEILKNLKEIKAIKTFISQENEKRNAGRRVFDAKYKKATKEAKKRLQELESFMNSLI
jgi:chromatin segregation and condensation protein Rec8/ScpA/Scc1 (kleisin family)